MAGGGGETAYPVRKALGFTAAQWARVRAFRFEHRFGAEAEAVRRLCSTSACRPGARACSRPTRDRTDTPRPRTMTPGPDDPPSGRLPRALPWAAPLAPAEAHPI